MNVNPFTYGNPISDPQRFFGRQREIEQVYSRLRNYEAESSSIVGERRIGKTSLLHYLKHPDVRHRYGVDDDHYIFIYSDLQMVDEKTTPSRLSQRFIHQFAQQCPDPELKGMAEDLSKVEEIDNFALADLFDSIDSKNFKVIFLLDEFEKVTSNPNFTPDYFYGLRSLAIQHNLTLITSSRSELIELTHSEAIRSSPFFNIFANINVRLFTEEEARELVRKNLAGSDVQFSPAEFQEIFSLAGNHPFFLQAACHFLFNAYTLNLGTTDRMQYFRKEFLEEVAGHMEHYWLDSPDNEKIVLTALALLERQGVAAERSFNAKRLRQLYIRSEQTLARLEKRGLVVKNGQGDALFNRAFSNWILGEISDTMSDPITYEDWLKSNQGSMERLTKEGKQHMVEILPKIGAKYRDLIIEWASDPSNLIAVASLIKGVLGV
jgi:hypothetical protein